MPAKSKGKEEQTLPPQEQDHQPGIEAGQILHPNGGEVVNG